jgi:tetratricopeptide (TPR) repeat protein
MNPRVPLPLLWATILFLFANVATAAASEVNQGWIEVRSAHFTVITNAAEKDGRHIADQFEQIRIIFHNTLTNLFVDTPQPIVILAAKNENTMKLLVPEDWEVKGHIHHAGLYQQGEDKHYVILQLDMGGDNPFHTLYHEYTHSLLHLNFSGLPLWLDEGIAEFFGNSTLGDKESRTGTIDQNHLRLLHQSRLIPIETLLEVDHKSPFYNEADRASIFYAQSWALVHYLLMDPGARQQQLFSKFLAAWDKSGDQVDAARQAFGDLKRFGQTIEAYSRQSTFHYAIVKSSKEELDKSTAARSISVAEVLALRGDAFSHRYRFDQAQPLLEQSVQLDPKLALAHEALGFLKYRKQDFPGAIREMELAAQLGSNSFATFYYQGSAILAGSSSNDDSIVQTAVQNFQRATQFNPLFAPAVEGLAQAYSQSSQTQNQAINAAVKAVKLDPGEHRYSLNLAYLLLNNNREDPARVIGQKLLAAAHSPQESQQAQELLSRISEREQWKAQAKAAHSATSGDPAADSFPIGGSSAANVAPAVSLRSSVPINSTTNVGVDGEISAIDCFA